MTVFTNPVWLPDRNPNVVADGEAGVDNPPSNYNKGGIIPFFFPPKKYCGTVRQWQDGSDIATDPPLTWTDLGHSTCCLDVVNPDFLHGGAGCGLGALWWGDVGHGGGAGGYEADF